VIEGGGSIVFEPDKPTYQKNNMITVTATPDEGWIFDHWEGALSGDQNPTTLRVSGDATLTAVFVDGSGPPPPPPPRARPFPSRSWSSATSPSGPSIAAATCPGTSSTAALPKR